MNDAMRVGGAAQQRHDASMAAQQQTAANQYNIYASRDERRVFSESVLVSRIKELEKWCREQVVACEAYAGILNAIDEDLIPRFRDDPDGIPIWENRAETLGRDVEGTHEDNRRAGDINENPRKGEGARQGERVKLGML